MALNTFGWSPAEVTTDSAGNVVTGVALTVYTDVTKANQVTGLFGKDGITAIPSGVVMSDSKGRFGFKASDAYSLLYVWDGSSSDPWPIAAHEAMAGAAGLTSSFLPQWKANTAYAAGQAVVNPSGDVVTAKAAVTSGATYDATKWNLSPNYARKEASGMGRHHIRKDAARRRKGGVIGTAGKPVVCFRADHGVDDFLAQHWPEFKSRGIPVSLGVLTRAMENPTDAYEPTSTTWATLKTEQAKGLEIWAHSHTHQDPDVIGTTIEQEVVGCRTILEANGINPIGFQMPGVPNGVTPNWSNNFVPDSWDSKPGNLLLSTYGLHAVTAQGGAVFWPPLEGTYNQGAYTLDSMTYTSAKALLDNEVLLGGYSIQYMLHPRFVAGGGYSFTTAQLIQLLDYVKTLWDQGKIEVLTVGGAAFADPGQTRRLDLCRDGGFENQATFPTSTWAKSGGTGTPTINTDGGHTGSKYLHFPAAAVYTYAYQGYTQLLNLQLKGGTMMVEAWVRATVSDTVARIMVWDATANVQLTQVLKTCVAGAAWQRVSVPFTIPESCDNLQIRINREGGSGDVDFDDVRVVVM